MNKILSGLRLVDLSRFTPSLWELRHQNNRAQASVLFAGISALLALVWLACPCLATSYTEHNLVSDLPGAADNTDPDLVNPWGIAASGTSPFWISDNHPGLSTLQNGAGIKQGLVVTIPPAGGVGQGAPTGTVFNPTGSFNGDLFLFATEGGTIDGWRGALGTTAETLFNNSAIGAVYKGIALRTILNTTNSYIYAADFHNGSVAVFPSTGAPALGGNFTDPNLPAGYAPFNIQNIGGTLFVTYALQDAAKHDDVAGSGHGFIDQFDTNGVFLKRFASMGPLNSPWGLALAPAGFGSFGGDLLVGNFGDGRINAFDFTTGAFLGSLTDASNNPIFIPGLWGLRFGNNGPGFDPDAVYFTAGIPGPGGQLEDHGLFGRISVGVPDSGATLILMIVGVIGLVVFDRAIRSGSRASVE